MASKNENVWLKKPLGKKYYGSFFVVCLLVGKGFPDYHILFEAKVKKSIY